MNLDQSLQFMHSAPAPKEDTKHKLGDLWVKVKPLVSMLGMIFGRKVKPYILAFIAAIDEIVADQEPE